MMKKERTYVKIEIKKTARDLFFFRYQHQYIKRDQSKSLIFLFKKKNVLF